jgi:hypothetical protein
VLCTVASVEQTTTDGHESIIKVAGKQLAI